MQKTNINNFKIPSDYSPINEISFCGNKFVQVKYFLEDNNFYPILIGQGDTPRIWLFAKATKNDFVTVIEDNVSKLKEVKIDIFQKEKRILITTISNSVSTVIIELYFNNEIPNVTHLDLRPVGYNIYGDETKLMISNSELRGNTMVGTNSIISLNNK